MLGDGLVTEFSGGFIVMRILTSWDWSIWRIGSLQSPDSGVGLLFQLGKPATG